MQEINKTVIKDNFNAICVFPDFQIKKAHKVASTIRKQSRKMVWGIPRKRINDLANSLEALTAKDLVKGLADARAHLDDTMKMAKPETSQIMKEISAAIDTLLMEPSPEELKQMAQDPGAATPTNDGRQPVGLAP